MWWKGLMRSKHLLDSIPLMLVVISVVTHDSGQNKSPEELILRLKGTGCRCSGWLEVLHTTKWKRIYSRNFTQQNAEFACRQLGCSFPFGILQPYFQDLEKQEACLMSCKGNETTLTDCILCDFNDSLSQGVALSCQVPVQATTVLQPTTASVVISSKNFDPPRMKLEEGTSLCSGTLEPDVQGYREMLCLGLQRQWNQLVPRVCQGAKCENENQDKKKPLHHGKTLQCEQRNLSWDCSGSAQECLNLALLRCSGQDSKPHESSSESVLGILLGLVLAAALLSICVVPTYKKIIKKHLMRRHQWIGPSGMSQNVSFHRNSSTAFSTRLESQVVQEEKNKASKKTYLSPYAALEGATNGPLDNSSDSDYDLCSAQQL